MTVDYNRCGVLGLYDITSSYYFLECQLIISAALIVLSFQYTLLCKFHIILDVK